VGKIKKIIIIIGLILLGTQALWAIITVDGYAYIYNQSLHDGIKVLFERVAPSIIIDSTYTNSDGYFTIDIETGLYYIKYSKNDYYSFNSIDNILYSNTTLQDITLYSYIFIPRDYTTIQEGIENCFEGDTVIVDIGTYIENINFYGKNITVASKYLTTNDNSYISQTIIDGDSSGCVVTFQSGEDSTSVLCGFTITNGGYHYSGGSGIRCAHSSPTLKHLLITGNNNGYYGGGLYCLDSSSPSLENVTITGNCAEIGGGICCLDNSYPRFNATNRCNIYSNTIRDIRGFGVEIYTYNCDIIDIIVDTFTVLTPTDYYATPIDNFTFDILYCVQGNLINSDLYVSVDGDDSNTGTSADEPFRTIKHALSAIFADSMNINTIHLATGVYSNSTNGETFPIKWSNYVNLQGNGENTSILDAQLTSRILEFDFVHTALIKDLVIKNGHDVYGGGIYCKESSPNLKNMIIEDNSTSISGGGGIYCSSSSPSLENVTITGNNAHSGGGIECCSSSSPCLENVTITGNSASNDGGGICCRSSSPSLENVTITSNSTGDDGCGIYCYNNSSPSLKNCIVSDNTGNYGIYLSSGNTTITYSDFYNNENGNFYNCGQWVGVNVTTNANGDSCDAYYNIQLDPLFVNPLNGDYHLSWANYPTPDYTMSPCIDAGDPSSPLDPDGTIADMGAYYFNQGVSIDEPVQSSGYNLTNYPNPINSNINNLKVSFNILKPSKVKIQLFNIKGQLVSTLMDEDKNVGVYTINHPANDLSSGIYFTRMSIDGVDKEVNKVILLR